MDSITDVRMLRIARSLRSIFRADKTAYTYHGKDHKNRFGECPKKGTRWATPAEIAKSALLNMGYDDPNDVPEE